MIGRYDASYGCFLHGDGKGNFSFVKPSISGLVLKGDVNDIKIIETADKQKILLTIVNNEPMKFFLIRKYINTS